MIMSIYILALLSTQKSSTSGKNEMKQERQSAADRYRGLVEGDGRNDFSQASRFTKSKVVAATLSKSSGRHEIRAKTEREREKVL